MVTFLTAIEPEPHPSRRSIASDERKLPTRDISECCCPFLRVVSRWISGPRPCFVKIMASSQSSASADTKRTDGMTTSFRLFQLGDMASTRKILDDRVLNQAGVGSKNSPRRDSLADAQAGADEEGTKDLWGQLVSLVTGFNGSVSTKMQKILSKADQPGGDLATSESTIRAMDLKDELQVVMDQMKGNFGDVPMASLDPTAFLYFLEEEDAKKNPSWKRRLHRFMPGMKLETVYGLHDALYLSQLAYVDTVEDVQRGLTAFEGADFELVFCTTEGKPRMPAYFVAIKKEGTTPSGKGNNDFIELILSVRGTKSLVDMVTDALLEERDYRGGKSHDGVCQSGLCVVEQTKDLLLHILETSGRKKLKLTLLGHSLGAGAAAIACIEFNDEPNIEASCIGFGCPALLNKELSEKWKDKITTIISDSDCVPRMSGATAANMLMDVLEYDGTEFAMEDVHQVSASSDREQLVFRNTQK